MRWPPGEPQPFLYWSGDAIKQPWLSLVSCSRNLCRGRLSQQSDRSWPGKDPLGGPHHLHPRQDLLVQDLQDHRPVLPGNSYRGGAAPAQLQSLISTISTWVTPKTMTALPTQISRGIYGLRYKVTHYNPILCDRRAKSMDTMQKFMILLHNGRNLKKQGRTKCERTHLLNLVRRTLLSYPGNTPWVITLRSMF